MTDADLASELRHFARRLRDPFADPAAVAAAMERRANALTPRPAGVVGVIKVGGRTIMVQRPRSGFGLLTSVNG